MVEDELAEERRQKEKMIAMLKDAGLTDEEIRKQLEE
jgi:hypothetical protein